MGFKGSFINLIFWGVFEFYYRARARQSLICPHCSFDPYLYKYDVKLARKKIEDHYAAQKAAKEAPAPVQPDKPEAGSAVPKDDE